MAFAPWAIGIIILVVIIAISTAVYFIFRKKFGKNKAAVGAQDEEMVLEKNVATPSCSTYPTNPLYNETDSTLQQSDDEKPVFTDNMKINLPLPPPSASLFSDKMELDSIEANDLYMAYMAASQNETIDEKPFLSNAAANIQQKAATLRSTLKQSLRRKPTHKNSVVPINQLFDITTSPSSKSSSIKSPIDMSRQSSSTFPRASLQTSNLLPPSPVPDSPSTLESFTGRYSNNSSKKSLIRHNDDATSTKIMIPDESYFSLPMSPISPSVGKPIAPKHDLVEEINQYTNDLEVEESEEEQDQTRQDSEEEIHSPQEAAAKLIRTASRKSRTRSIKMNDQADTSYTNNISTYATVRDKNKAQPVHVSTYATVREKNKAQPTHISTYATVRGKKPPVQKIDTATRPGLEELKKWSLLESTSPKRTLMSSNVSGSATVSGKRAQKTLQNNNNTATIGRTSLQNLFSKQQNENSGNVDTIRRMLQSSWSGNNIKESGSNNSLSSSSEVISPVGSINPRLQNQHLVSLSLKASTSRTRPSMPAGFMEQEGPAPTVSFSSSTVRTMIPAEEDQEQRKPKKKLRPSRLGKTPAQKEREKYLKSLH